MSGNIVVVDQNMLLQDFDFSQAKGLIKDHERFEKYGRITGVQSADAAQDIWNGAGNYTGHPTGAAETMEISSSSDLDTVTSGTGAWTVEISNLLDANYNKMPNITVALDGNPAVAGSWVSLGAVEYLRGGSRVRVITGGSGGSNAGAITLRHTATTANIFAVMPIGRNSTAIGAFTVPNGMTLYINKMLMQMARANGGAGSGDMTFRARKLGEVFQAIVSPEITNSKDYLFENDGYFVYEQKTDLKMRVEDSSANDTIFTAEFSGRLVTN